MELLYARCAGLDVHKKSVVACRRYPGEDGKPAEECRTFGTMTPDLLALSDWLQSGGVTHVGMESTGVYWQPVYNVLEGLFEEVLVVNAHHFHNVPGRKTDVNDARWIAEVLAHGLVKASFVPAREQRDLRDLTRHRANFVRERSNVLNRIQKLLEGANIKLASVASDVNGKSGRAMLDALVAGTVDPSLLADLACGRLRQKREQLERALVGQMRAHQRLILSELLCQLDSLDESIERLDAAIGQALDPFEPLVELLDTIPGVARQSAEVILSEVGTSVERFPTAGHLSAWAGVAPGNHQSGGKRLASKSRHGNRALCSQLVQCARAASRTKGTYLSAQYQRLRARRGDKRAALAVAHSILVIAYHIIQRRVPYNDLGADYFDRQRPEATAKRLIARLAALGYTVTSAPAPTPGPAAP